MKNKLAKKSVKELKKSLQLAFNLGSKPMTKITMPNITLLAEYLYLTNQTKTQIFDISIFVHYNISLIISNFSQIFAQKVTSL